MEFRLVRDQTKDKKNIDTLGFEYKDYFKDSEGKERFLIARTAVAAVIKTVSSISEDLSHIHNPTDSMHIVLKTIHKNNKGYYYNFALSKGYGSKITRVYLTDEESLELNIFLNQRKQYHDYKERLKENGQTNPRD